MTLQLSDQFRFGVLTKHNRKTTGPWQPGPNDMRDMVELIDNAGYDSLWVGDHLAFTVPVLDPLIQLAQAATYSSHLELGVSVYLLPLRHTGPAAKQIATLDHLSDGRLILGVGVGGEFKDDFHVAGVDPSERGARLNEGIQVLRKLWSGDTVSHDGKYFAFPELKMSPPARQPNGPPIWCGGRSPAALRRAGELCDGWLSYVVTPEMYADSLTKINDAAGDGPDRPFGTGHLLFAWVDDSYEAALDKATESLSLRYAMDFREAAKKYCALGRAEEVAEKLQAYHDAGLRHAIMDFVGPMAEHDAQVTRFADEVFPLMKSFR